MKYHSTRDQSKKVLFSRALEKGLAPDGGLYIPEQFPDLEIEFSESIIDVAVDLLDPFVTEDELHGELEEICRETFSFPIPLRKTEAPYDLLELFHGPTAAFKDIGARFLASCVSRLESADGEPVTILVATSGDTGSAVASAFYRKPNTRVVVLYPRGHVSDRQERQLTCWDHNITTLAVEGTFDDCQNLAKEAFKDDWWQDKRLSSANSINIGRLLPQLTYYAFAALSHFEQHGRRPNFIVPTGNLGNGLACVYARECGLPIGEIILATNENKPLTHYYETGTWREFETIETPASAMDVGNPSNMERLLDLWPEPDLLRENIDVHTVSNLEIEESIRREARECEIVCGPHTATAAHVARIRDRQDDIAVATAHPGKFDDIVTPLVDDPPELPENIRRMIEGASSVPAIEPDLGALRDAVARDWS